MPSKFHGTGPFDIATGQQKSSGDKDTYTDVFAKVMYRMGKEEPKLVAITAAMKDGTGLTPFAKKYPDRFLMSELQKSMRLLLQQDLQQQG